MLSSPVTYIVRKTFDDMQTWFEHESAAKDAKRSSRAGKVTADMIFTMASNVFDQQMRWSFVNSFDDAVHATVQAKLIQTKEEYHAKE